MRASLSSSSSSASPATNCGVRQRSLQPTHLLLQVGLLHAAVLFGGTTTLEAFTVHHVQRTRRHPLHTPASQHPLPVPEHPSSSVLLGAIKTASGRVGDDLVAEVAVKRQSAKGEAKKKNPVKKKKKNNNKETATTTPITTATVDNIPLQTQLDYIRQGHASIRNFIPPSQIQQIYHDLKTYHSSYHNRNSKGEDSKPFMQYFNTWRHDDDDAGIPSIKQLATSPLLCHAASTLLGIPSVRLYQDSIFIKRHPKDGITPWHIDARMIPLDTSRIITFWIPLHSIPSLEDGGTGLLFINKSHSDMALPYWNGRGNVNGDDDDSSTYNAYSHLTTRYGIDNNVGDDRIVDNNPGVIDHHMPLSVGDCTVHSGWTMHCANGNTQNGSSGSGSGVSTTRYAVAITYVDSRAEVREDVPGVGKNVPVAKRGRMGNNNNGSSTRSRTTTKFMGDDEDSVSYSAWIGDVLPRTQFQHKLVPDVWPPPSSSSKV